MDPLIPEPPESPRLFRPRTVGEILSHAFQLYGQHWKNLFAMVAVVMIPLAIGQALITDLWLDESLTSEEIRDGVTVVVDGAFFAGIAASLVFLLFSVLGYTALQGAITRAAAGTFLGRDMDIGESLRFGLVALLVDPPGRHPHRARGPRRVHPAHRPRVHLPDALLGIRARARDRGPARS